MTRAKEFLQDLQNLCTKHKMFLKNYYLTMPDTKTHVIPSNRISGYAKKSYSEENTIEFKVTYLTDPVDSMETYTRIR